MHSQLGDAETLYRRPASTSWRSSSAAPSLLRATVAALARIGPGRGVAGARSSWRRIRPGRPAPGHGGAPGGAAGIGSRSPPRARERERCPGRRRAFAPISARRSSTSSPSARNRCTRPSPSTRPRGRASRPAAPSAVTCARRRAHPAGGHAMIGRTSPRCCSGWPSPPPGRPSASTAPSTRTSHRRRRAGMGGVAPPRRGADRSRHPRRRPLGAGAGTCWSRGSIPSAAPAPPSRPPGPSARPRNIASCRAACWPTTPAWNCISRPPPTLWPPADRPSPSTIWACPTRRPSSST